MLGEVRLDLIDTVASATTHFVDGPFWEPQSTCSRSVWSSIGAAASEPLTSTAVGGTRRHRQDDRLHACTFGSTLETVLHDGSSARSVEGRTSGRVLRVIMNIHEYCKESALCALRCAGSGRCALQTVREAVAAYDALSSPW